jgi:hypothetical protein
MVTPKRPVGHPPIFNNPEEMKEKIDAYFAQCDARKVERFDKEGKVYLAAHPEPYTMAGLAFALNVDRQTILNYGKKEEFFGTIKKARMKVEMDVERRLMETTNQTGAIFNLKNNFGWVDKQETSLSNPDGSVFQLSLTDYSSFKKQP